MKMTDLPVMQRFIRMCNDGWLQGWHERNGGNFTYRLTQEEAQSARALLDQSPGDWQPLPVSAQNLAGEYFITTGSGKFMRNVILEPENCLGVVQINPEGNGYRTVWGFADGGRPTSEFPTHFMNHSVRLAATQGACRLIYHAHPANAIAMTYIVPLSARAFTRALWQSATECPVVFPGGIGVVPWMVPGGAAIAHATSKLMAEYDAIVWTHHGLFVSGSDFDTTFGLMHTIEKSAEIYMKVLASGRPVLQTITDADLRAIAEEFGVTLREEFLDA